MKINTNRQEFHLLFPNLKNPLKSSYPKESKNREYQPPTPPPNKHFDHRRHFKFEVPPPHPG